MAESNIGRSGLCSDFYPSKVLEDSVTFTDILLFLSCCTNSLLSFSESKSKNNNINKKERYTVYVVAFIEC